MKRSFPATTVTTSVPSSKKNQPQHRRNHGATTSNMSSSAKPRKQQKRASFGSDIRQFGRSSMEDNNHRMTQSAAAEAVANAKKPNPLQRLWDKQQQAAIPATAITSQCHRKRFSVNDQHSSRAESPASLDSWYTEHVSSNEDAQVARIHAQRFATTNAAAGTSKMDPIVLHDDDDDCIAIPELAVHPTPTKRNSPRAPAPSTNSIQKQTSRPLYAHPVPPMAVSARAIPQPAAQPDPALQQEHDMDLAAQTLLQQHVEPDLYTWQEFEDLVDKMTETMTHAIKDKDPLVAIEKGICKEANYKVMEQFRLIQQKAQYGRVEFAALHKLFGPNYFDLKASDVFVDLGHGSGLPNLQAAYTVGCASRGIELDKSRYLVSEELLHMFQHQLQAIQNRTLPHRKDQVPPNGGVVEFVLGSLNDLTHLEFLTNPKGITKCLVNNFGGVFADRSKITDKGSPYHPDHFVAGLFALMQPGSIMITLHPLDLGSTLKKANDNRTRHNLRALHNASFYEMEMLNLGPQKDTVSWSSASNTPLLVYKYTRIGQSKFACGNPNCPERNNLQDATEYRTLMGEIPTEDTPREQQVVVIRSCTCGQNSRSTRQLKSAGR